MGDRNARHSHPNAVSPLFAIRQLRRAALPSTPRREVCSSFAMRRMSECPTLCHQSGKGGSRVYAFAAKLDRSRMGATLGMMVSMSVCTLSHC